MRNIHWMHRKAVARMGKLACLALLATAGGCTSAPAPPSDELRGPVRLVADADMDASMPGSVESRSFAMEIRVTVKAPAAAAARRLDVWLPVPGDDRDQTIRALRVESPWAHAMSIEPVYGGRVLHAWTDAPAATTLKVSFEATRKVVSAPRDEVRSAALDYPAARYLEPDRLGVIDAGIRRLAGEITAGKVGTEARARAIYDYVTGHMAYDKTAPGWGQGDTARACAIGKGNCTDFHALFISLARASGIPARFKIGYQIPTAANALHPASLPTALTGYHCWSEFWRPKVGWVAVDCSEAWKDPSRHDFYFGNLDDNRIEMSAGRDLKLPGMRGEPLNYLLGPYAELDGKPYAGVESAVTFAVGR